MLLALIDKKGNVSKIKIKKSLNNSLDKAAIEALKQWKFEPAKRNGKPVAVWVSVPFEFSIK